MQETFYVIYAGGKYFSRDEDFGAFDNAMRFPNRDHAQHELRTVEHPENWNIKIVGPCTEGESV